jgi:hypothetical protein
MEQDMRRTLSFIALIALICAGSAVAQMPMDSTTRKHLTTPQSLLTPTDGTRTMRDRELLLIKGDSSSYVASHSSTDAAPTPSTRYNFTGDEAAAYLAKHGYTNVNGLRQDSNSVWRALAERNDHQVEVAVDYQGNIFER